MNHYRNNRGSATSSVLCLVCIILLIIWAAIRIVANINFDRKCEGYLKRAADANTVILAKKQLEIAIAYMDKKELTEGYTSVLYRTPDEDVGFWYTNIKDSLAELNAMAPEATQLERSNMLMKLRETLLDNTTDGTSVTFPDGISIFPYNKLLAYGSIILLIIGVISGFLFDNDGY